MPDYNLSWQLVDAQFLEAILLATGGEGGASLQDVLLMADAVDGTVYTFKELEEVLEKLIAASLVRILKKKLALTPVFMQTYDLNNESASTPEAILSFLQSVTLTAKGIDEARAELKQYKLNRHYQQYQEQYG